MNTVKSAARDVKRSPVARGLARAGFVANGLVHVLLGVIVLVIAFGGTADGDQSGALQAVAAAPFGFVALWAAAVSLVGLAVFSIVEGIVQYGSGDAKAQARKWGRRLARWGKALAFAATGVIAAAAALGARRDADASAQEASRGVLVMPGGPLVLGLVGLVIGVIGISFGVIGIRRSFRQELSVPDGPQGRVITVLGVVGYLAKGAALLIVGALVLVAAIRSDADAAGGLDGALQALRETMFGPALVTLVGAGLIAYGLFLIARSRYARL